jgi:hypothetical protein
LLTAAEEGGSFEAGLELVHCEEELCTLLARARALHGTSADGLRRADNSLLELRTELASVQRTLQLLRAYAKRHAL